MNVAYPVTLPGPTTAPLQSVERRLLGDLPGARQSRVLQRDRLARQQLSFVFTFAEAALFVAWVRDTLLDGGAWFTAVWPQPQGGSGVRRFIGAPAYPEFLPGVGWRVSAVCELAGRGFGPPPPPPPAFVRRPGWGARPGAGVHDAHGPYLYPFVPFGGGWGAVPVSGVIDTLGPYAYTGARFGGGWGTDPVSGVMDAHGPYLYTGVSFGGGWGGVAAGVQDQHGPYVCLCNGEPMQMDPIYFTSYLYPLIAEDAAGAGMDGAVSGLLVEWPADSADAGMALFAGDLRDVLQTYGIGPTHPIDAGMAVQAGALVDVLHPYANAPTEPIDAGMSVVAGTLVLVLIPYSNWPTDPIDATVTVIAGTLTP